MVRGTRKFWALATGAVLMTVAGQGTRGEEKVTDEQVVTAMTKGVDFLLSAKKVDNWETTQVWPGVNENKGGVTALVLYSLLHARGSLQDMPEYQAKLNWRGPELSPAIVWLTKYDAMDTYTVGLAASALTLLPKRQNEKSGDGASAALERSRIYLQGAMGLYGGYDYSQPGASKTMGTFLMWWEKYFDAKMSGNQAAVDAARPTLDHHIQSARQTFGGVEGAFTRLIAELRLKKKGTTDAREAAKIDREIKEAEAYFKTNLPKPGQDFAAEYAEAKAKMNDFLEAQRTGEYGKLQRYDKTLNKNVPMTKADFPGEMEGVKKWLERVEFGFKNKFRGLGDLSNAQYGTLGAWALMDYGIELPMAYWAAQDHFWRMLQRPDGTWPYYADLSQNDASQRPAIAVAGIASLFVCQEFVDTQLRSLPKEDKNIEAGLAWLNKNYAPDTGNFYYMYGVERVGLSSGLKFFGTTDWFKEGAASLVKRQGPNGAWDGEYGPEVSTAYAIAFLARGRNPIVFNKLQHNGPWNARPRDDAYVTRWLSNTRFERPINWQVVNLQVPVTEWMDAPILLITGSVDPKFTKDDVAKLREFTQMGGLIFSTSDDNSAAFTAAMQRYAGEMVEKKYEMRPLSRNHVLLSRDLGVELVNPPQLLGMSNGVRELWIHSPHDVGASWQMRRFASKDHFELAAALYLYSTGMGSLRSKLQPLAVNVGGEAAAHAVEVARIDHAGNADPEPGAWARMSKLARAGFKTDVKLTKVKFAELDAKKFKLAHLTGTTTVTFSEEDAKALRKYLDDGGLLLADASGGSAEFGASVKTLLKQTYPEKNLMLLPPDSPIYTGSIPDGAKLENVDFRKYGAVKLKRRLTSPELWTLEGGERTKVLFSEYDVSSGFLGTKTWGIVGYNPATAELLGRNILLYAAEGKAAN